MEEGGGGRGREKGRGGGVAMRSLPHTSSANVVATFSESERMIVFLQLQLHTLHNVEMLTGGILRHTLLCVSLLQSMEEHCHVLRYFNS